MAKKGASQQRGDPESDKKSSQGKIRSDFPKHTLEEAIRVAKALEEKNGGQPLPPTETAIAVGKSPGSSDFRVLLSSSIKYGLTSGSYNQERVSLQELGRNIVEPTSQESSHRALVTAALNPPTFRTIYDYFKGKKLPEATFFQNTIVREFQVPREQSGKCVNVFSTNMEYVGLIRTASTGKWLSTEALPKQTVITDTEEIEDLEESAELDKSQPTTPVSPPESDKPTVRNAIFLGHGKNKKPLEQLKQILDQYKIPYKVAVDEPNRFRPISQKVADIMGDCGAAILIFTADEEFQDIEGNAIWKPSENVVYELGAASVLYGGRIIIFKEEAVHFPANFRDIGYIDFQKDALSAKTNELFKELISFGLIKVTVGV
ncbi:MAG: TIR domain-containing protein [Candidatus Binatia bacterium]